MMWGARVWGRLHSTGVALDVLPHARGRLLDYLAAGEFYGDHVVLERRMTKDGRRLLQQPPKVVERFIRLLIFRKVKRIVHAVARRISRRRLLRSERPRAKALSNTLEACARGAMRARRNKLKSSEAVFNLALFFLVAERDIQAVKVDALTHPDPWRRSLSARVILLTIHELDLDKVGGNKLRQALEDAAVPDTLKKEVAAALRVVRVVQQKAQRQFANMRHTTIAHRDPDAILQYRSITEVDGLSVVQTAAEFYAGTHAFMDVMPRLLSHVGGMRSLISQLVTQGERAKNAKQSPKREADV